MKQLPFAIDRRDNLRGQAVTHALLIGISHYDYLSSLGAGAHTAVRIFEWLKQAEASSALTASLATVTLLLSPGKLEKPTIAELVGEDAWALATGDNITLAQQRLHELICETEKELIRPDDEIGAGMAIYYFGGHGTDSFSADPIGLAQDANTTKKLWTGAVDHQDFRESLIRIEADGLPTDSSGRTRCLFMYDCCRTPPPSTDPEQLNESAYRNVLEQAEGVRPYQILLAAERGFSAWEPSQVINIDPKYDIPLSFFGHALLRAIEWSQDFSLHAELTWQTDVRALEQDIRRCMNELAGNDGTGEGLGGNPVNWASGPTFAVVRSASPPMIEVLISCHPETGRDTMQIGIDQRIVTGYELQRRLPPWTSHPESAIFAPGVFRIEATTGSGNLERQVRLRPVLTSWQWIISDDDIAVYDPSN